MAARGGNFGIAHDTANGHRKIEGDFITGLPFAGNFRVSVVRFQGQGFAVDLETPLRRLIVFVGVKIAGQRLALGPTGDAQANGEILGFRGEYFEADPAIPRVVCGLLDFDFITTDWHGADTAGVEVHKELLGLDGIDIVAQGSDGAQDIWRAARTAEPRCPTREAVVVFGGAVVFQRVGIKEPVAAQGHAAEGPVVERALEDIHILGIRCKEKHPLVPKHESQRGTGFVITTVGKFVIDTVGFALLAGATATGEMQFGSDHISPNLLESSEITHVTRQGRVVRHATVEVVCPNGVPHGFVLFQNGLVILGVFSPKVV